MAVMTTQFFTATEIAKLLKISKALAYRLIAQGELPAIRFGRTVRVRQEDLDSFILNNGTNHSQLSSNASPRWDSESGRQVGKSSKN
jgi:excisionase family DNA binding protein